MASDPDGGDHRRDRKYDLVSATRRAPLTLAGNEPTSILSSIDQRALQSIQSFCCCPREMGNIPSIVNMEVHELSPNHDHYCCCCRAKDDMFLEILACRMD